ncbi:Mediator of RNA polymerase II transcription subunit [Drechslerella dactyloides]|uniref:Mediator of RNA polymerase II transcription subunit 31 n=1 Tax=Drechslerella dactyloides TaxID=74499 RepID=A0AAD6IRC3_DREDA|nr:Mediator of RNA polymerase II transcription subunit [Drechslerella dactyloides]
METAPTPDDKTRFEMELEFVQCLANPFYLNYLAQSKYLQDEPFLRYIEYLDYWRQPEYVKFLVYPSFTLNALDLLKQPQFRQDILSPDTAKKIMDDMLASLHTRNDD